MNINSLQLNSIKFTGAKFSPVLNRVRPLVTKPNVNTFDRSMKIVGIATSALFLATGAMNKSNEIIFIIFKDDIIGINILGPDSA